jgi:hypothetical protein
MEWSERKGGNKSVNVIQVIHSGTINQNFIHEEIGCGL